MEPENENNKFCSTTGSPTSEEIENDIYKLKFSVCSSIRYHSKRKRFFENFHNVSNAGVVITGSSAFVALLSNGSGSGATIALWLTAIVTVLTSLDLVFSFSARARTHDALRKKYANLLKNISLGDATLKAFKERDAEKIMIEVQEPTRLKVLGIYCHNEECIALGHSSSNIYELGTIRTLLKDWWSFDSYTPVTAAQKLKN